eukprot:gnl/TRDRNA2_/TRDRNA2_137311_c1_seq1.p2 gnl/TRDRNA2_/TRDRNA2_137311_c1~~gnl/TRDRNA2_/TRDRNA2_137311_c1_seq1.p2  ORF type:complete len:109 (-),score=4.11 gnl/TRDRNA2_/TRDRNA2_137311_c1_seq1:246-572(-)
MAAGSGSSRGRSSCSGWSCCAGSGCGKSSGGRSGSGMSGGGRMERRRAQQCFCRLLGEPYELVVYPGPLKVLDMSPLLLVSETPVDMQHFIWPIMWHHAAQQHELQDP